MNFRITRRHNFKIDMIWSTNFLCFSPSVLLLFLQCNLANFVCVLLCVLSCNFYVSVASFYINFNSQAKFARACSVNYYFYYKYTIPVYSTFFFSLYMKTFIVSVWCKVLRGVLRTNASYKKHNHFYRSI